MTGSWMRRRATGAPDRPIASPTPRTMLRERWAIVAVLVLCVTTAIGSGTHALPRAVDLAGPALLGGTVGAPPAGPPTGSPPLTGSPSAALRPSAGPSGPPTSTTTTTPGARPDAKATAKKKKVIIAASAPLRYTSNSTSAKSGGSGRVIRFDVWVQKGLPYDVDDVAPQIAATLNDPGSWRADGRQRFQLVRAGDDAELHAYLVTPGTTDRLCAPLRTGGEVSCQVGDKVVLNAKRWAFAVPEFTGRIPLYRQYLVNHEFGHYLGHGHVGCPAKGRLAPVMMQQTKGLDGCKANAWPYPKKR